MKRIRAIVTYVLLGIMVLGLGMFFTCAIISSKLTKKFLDNSFLLVGASFMLVVICFALIIALNLSEIIEILKYYGEPVGKNLKWCGELKSTALEIIDQMKSQNAKGELNRNGINTKKKIYYNFMQTNLAIHFFIAFVIILISFLCGIAFRILNLDMKNIDSILFLFLIVLGSGVLDCGCIGLILRFDWERRHLEQLLGSVHKCKVFYAKCTENKSVNGLIFLRTFKMLDESGKVFKLNSLDKNASVLLSKEGDVVTMAIIDDRYIVIY